MPTAGFHNIYTADYLAEDRKQIVINCMICFAVLETLFFVLFGISRYQSKLLQGWDTWLMIPAYFVCLTHTIVGMYCATNNILGKHAITASAHTVRIWLKVLVVEWFVYSPSVALPRLCIVGFYLRLFTTRPYRYATYGIATIITLMWVIGYILNFTMCTPFQYSWDKTIPGGHCIDLPAEHLWVSLPNIITDVAILLLPLPVIWYLPISRSQRIGLTISFTTFSIGLVTACLRFKTFSNKDLFIDVTWYSVDAIIWTTAESGVYFIAACLPHLRTLFKPLLEKLDFSLLQKVKLTMGAGTRKSAIDRSKVETSPTPTSFTWDQLRDECLLPHHSDGNDQKEVVACFHIEGCPRPVLRLDTLTDDLEKGYGSGRSEEIQVQKSYGISMMPRVHRK